MSRKTPVKGMVDKAKAQRIVSIFMMRNKHEAKNLLLLQEYWRKGAMTARLSAVEPKM